MMDDSMLRYTIYVDDHLRRRVTAIVMNAKWDDEESEVTTAVPLDDIMWAVAANDSILGGVKDRMSQQGEDSEMPDPAVKAVSDTDLEFVVISQALPRINRKTEEPM